MQDLISRQAAIDAIHCDITVTGRQNAELVAATIGAFADRIKEMPTADVIEIGKPYFYEEGYVLKDFHNDGVHRYFVIERADT